jgi:outer membrane receptor protein involved in Fe transport
MARHSRSQGIARSTLTRGLPLASALMAAVSAAMAQQAPATSEGLEEIIVTAQKRAEDIQNVPMSIQALSTQKLEENHVASFQDYAKLLPSVTFQDGAAAGGGGGPGFARVYMRGVVSGGDGNHSGSQPSVGMYLDEQPITTIQGSLDIHIYDIERVEALAGPQGTLYGASSQAGTIRIITNKPELGVTKGGYDVQGNTVKNGTFGYTAEGFANLPVGDSAAIRLVGWTEHDSGYIDNRHAAFTYSTGVAVDNQAFAKQHYNDTTTTGGRAALKIDLNERWTVTPSVIAQQQKSNGFSAFDPKVGDLAVTHYKPEGTLDNWVQAALTVEGKIGNFDLVYAGSFLKRHDETQLDYTDYSLAYDNLYGSAANFVDNSGNPVDGSQYIVGKDHYQKYSNELRISSPKDYALRFVGGLFQQRQQHEIEQRYLVNGLANSIWVPGWADTLWLTQEERVDRDSAIFAELSYDLAPKLTATAGLRYFKSKNSLQGFYGFGPGYVYAANYGYVPCLQPLTPFHGAPCQDIDSSVSDSGTTPKFNLTYHIDDAHMVYATISRGFRPGGLNRYNLATDPLYKPDFLTNYELGWKSSWLGNRLRFNGAIFQEKWKDFQFAYLGNNSLTVIRNAGQARINGIETSLDWAAATGLNVGAAIALYDAKLTEDFCSDATAAPGSCPSYAQAPSGTQLPVTPKFKGDFSARYKFSAMGVDSFVQGSVAYVGARWPELRTFQRGLIGQEPAYTIVDVSAGMNLGSSTLELFVGNLFDERAQLQRFTMCSPTMAGGTPLCAPDHVYIQSNQPRTIGLKWGQKF